MKARHGATPTSLKVLIVDHHELTRTLLRSILRSNDYQVIGEARNGVGALELAERLRPDIICMEVLMPQMGGLEALQAIKSMYPQIVVVMVTGRASVDIVREAIQSGASGFIVKPFKVGKILDTLRLARPSSGQAIAESSNGHRRSETAGPG